MNFDAPANDEIFDANEHQDPFDDRITTVCFTGHRSIPENVRPAISELLSEVILGLYLRGARVFKAGGAIGFDTMAAQAVIDLRSKTGDRSVKLSLCLPAPDQAKKFSQFDKIIYDLVRENSDCVTYVAKYSTTESYYERNRRLVQGSDVCVAYCTKQRGGTYYTCKQALLGGIEFINLADFIVFE